jgi:hypothetical protein
MMMLRLLVLSCPVLLLGCGARGPTETEPLDNAPQQADVDKGPAKNRLDSQTRAVFAGATKVEVFRLVGRERFRDGEEKPKEGRRIGGFRVTGQGKDQGRTFARKLLGILDDDRTYSKRFKECFWPGVTFRVWKEKECIEVLICFICDNFYCGPPTKGQANENASFVGSPRRADLVRLAREAFPDDKEIQALKEKE